MIGVYLDQSSRGKEAQIQFERRSVASEHGDGLTQTDVEKRRGKRLLLRGDDHARRRRV